MPRVAPDRVLTDADADQLAAALFKALQASLGDANKAQRKTYGGDQRETSALDPDAVYLLAQHLQLIRDITATTRKRVQAIIEDGLRRGLGYREIARDIEADERGIFSPARARLIARTSTAHYYNVANAAMHQRNGVEYFRVFDGVGCGWSSHDDTPKADGLIVTASQAIATPLSHPNCVRVLSAMPVGWSPDATDNVLVENVPPYDTEGLDPRSALYLSRTRLPEPGDVDGWRAWFGQVAGNDLSDEHLSNRLHRLLGTDGLPTVLSPDAFEQAQINRRLGLFVRGNGLSLDDPPEEWARRLAEFETGKYWGGRGVLGEGLYAWGYLRDSGLAEAYQGAMDYGLALQHFGMQPWARAAYQEQIGQFGFELYERIIGPLPGGLSNRGAIEALADFISGGDSALRSTVSAVLYDQGMAARLLGYDIVLDLPMRVADQLAGGEVWGSRFIGIIQNRAAILARQGWVSDLAPGLLSKNFGELVTREQAALGLLRHLDDNAPPLWSMLPKPGTAPQTLDEWRAWLTIGGPRITDEGMAVVADAWLGATRPEWVDDAAEFIRRAREGDIFFGRGGPEKIADMAMEFRDAYSQWQWLAENDPRRYADALARVLSDDPQRFGWTTHDGVIAGALRPGANVYAIPGARDPYEALMLFRRAEGARDLWKRMGLPDDALVGDESIVDALARSFNLSDYYKFKLRDDRSGHGLLRLLGIDAATVDDGRVFAWVNPDRAFWTRVVDLDVGKAMAKMGDDERLAAARAAIAKLWPGARVETLLSSLGIETPVSPEIEGGAIAEGDARAALRKILDDPRAASAGRPLLSDFADKDAWRAAVDKWEDTRDGELRNVLRSAGGGGPFPRRLTIEWPQAFMHEWLEDERAAIRRNILSGIDFASELSGRVARGWVKKLTGLSATNLNSGDPDAIHAQAHLRFNDDNSIEFLFGAIEGFLKNKRRGLSAAQREGMLRSIAAHEVGHFIEKGSDDIWRKAQDFRAGLREADNPDPYLLRRYEGGDTEVISVLVQHLYAHPFQLAREYPRAFRFIVETLRLLEEGS